MFIKSASRVVLAITLVLSSHVGNPVLAENNPIVERQELMKGVRDAAKPVGEMLKGETDFDAPVFMQSMAVFEESAHTYGGLFPEGSQSEESEATSAVWDDREGFEAALDKWLVATEAAIAANPQTLDEARPVAGPVFQSCKGCHDDYRLKRED